ncbi:hypothetical protein Ga0074812_12082 [Parafrankia irregularis]|uniref:Uncharacterized protein n=1 Tax=Parafrankia irregularis TaxID=795642 RepID=A0A0S4QSH7_9ACTN|nr:MULTISPECIES: hypothetical protein [Parafrankia]CUU58583.1 hypothetical protein Ga0074812_12082 [Parafrankia irregularis]
MLDAADAALVDELVLLPEDPADAAVPLSAAAELLPDESPSDEVADDSFGRAGTPEEEPERLSVL